jgi:PAS domain S-box-containing protein
MALLLDQSEDYALFFTTPEGVITDWYPGAAHIFGFSAGEVVGEQATRLFNSEDLERGAAEHEMAVARKARRAEDDRWHVRKDGTRFWGSGVLFGLHDPAGNLVAYAKIARNRTDVKTQTEALENQVKALSRAESQNKVLLATLAHELRNPLGPLVNAVQLLRDSDAPPGALQIIDRQLALLRRLVDDLMEASRIGAGKAELRLSVFDLREVFHAAAESVRPMVSAREHEFQVIPIAGPVPVKADAQRLQQVFLNLLDNAIKYTPRGGKIVFNIRPCADMRPAGWASVSRWCATSSACTAARSTAAAMAGTRAACSPCAFRCTPLRSHSAAQRFSNPSIRFISSGLV